MLTEHTVMKQPMAIQECSVTECVYLVEAINNCYIAHPFPFNYLDRRLRNLKEKKKKKNNPAPHLIEFFFVHV